MQKWKEDDNTAHQKALHITAWHHALVQEMGYKVNDYFIYYS